MEIKVYIPRSEELRGPKIFCSRLHKAMLEIPDVELTALSSCTIQLQPIVFQNMQKDVKNVLRLDGVYIRDWPEYNWRKQNKPIKVSFDAADGIIYQSNFSKVLCEKYLGKTRAPHAVIYNGADPEDYKPVSSKGCRPFFLAVANWRIFKRLGDTIESFLLADLRDTDLVIVGDVVEAGIGDKLEKYRKNPRIRFLGELSQEKLIPYYVSCIALVHISWIDNCPNSVVEAICAGKPVICGNVGGTKEIVQESEGLVLDIDEDYDLEPINLYEPPSIPRNLVVEAMHSCIHGVFNISNTHVDIRNIAVNYLNFFRKVK